MRGRRVGMGQSRKDVEKRGKSSRLADPLGERNELGPDGLHDPRPGRSPKSFIYSTPIPCPSATANQIPIEWADFFPAVEANSRDLGIDRAGHPGDGDTKIGNRFRKREWNPEG